ncbi:uncharacterized protein LOC134798119 [Cydia splendana]|uniref:uncharacterized protein LOC134798119 n=1 Tax=Cydia splendana TaxID=1100963 RepID=UPI00300D8481
MPKRKNEEELELLAKRLKKLKKDLKRNRRSFSSSSCSTCSSSSSSSSEAASINPDYQNDRDATARACDDAPPPPPPAQVAGRCSEVEPIAGPSHETEPIANPSHTIEPIAGPSHAMPVYANLPPANMTVEPIEIEDDDICQAEILEILGTDPSLSQEYGEDINKEVASRFEHIATSGLEKQSRQELLDKYLVPSNCMKIAAPQLNAEIKAASTEAVVKRDKAIELRQKQIAAAITGVGRLLTSQLKSKDKSNNISKQLMDVARLLCDIQYGESSTRRNFTLYSLKKDFRDQLANTKIDRYLFGEDLPETLKTAKAVSKSGTDIKVDQQKSKHIPSKFPKNLNWKMGPSARNQPKGPTQKHQSAASSNRRYGHGSSSHRSSHRAKHNRQR